jgi:small-conductance mechanosensitive channel
MIAFIGGIASQQIFSNVVGGLFISLTNPFTIGDHIEIIEEKIGGTVEDITLRHVIIRSDDKQQLIIPNAKFNNLTIKKLT